MRIEDMGSELMRLYRLLRSTPDTHKRDAIKARIDQIVQEARDSFVPQIVGNTDDQADRKSG